MKYKITNELLKYTIDELGEEYKDLLLQKVMNDTGESNIEHIYLIDLIRVDKKIKVSLEEPSEREYFRITLIVATITVLIFLIVFMVFILLKIYNYEKFLLFSMVCFVTALETYALLMAKKLGKIESSRITNYDIICKWKECEIVFNKKFGSTAIYQWKNIVDELRNEKVVTNEDIVALEKLRVIRNNVVHSNGTLHMKQQDLRLLFKKVNDLLLKLNEY